MNPLKQLEACGQAPWLDYLIHSLVEKGDLKKMIEEDGLRGVTSNPSIFQKAIGESDEYADAMKSFLAEGDHSVSEIYEHLAVADIQAACDVMRPVQDETKGRDGYVSLECSPYLANDTEATVKEAIRLRGLVDRPNLMVKVPATPNGIPAIQRLIGEGMSINITLLFSIEAYEKVVEAYISGLEAAQKAGKDIAAGGQRRLLLRQPHRQRRGQEARGRGQGEALRQGRHRQRQAGLRPLQGTVLRPEVGGAGQGRRAHPAPALGLDLGQGQGAEGHPLRRSPDRQRHGGHHPPKPPWTPSATTAW